MNVGPNASATTLALWGFPFVDFHQRRGRASRLSLTWEHVRLSRRRLPGGVFTSLWRNHCILQLASHQPLSSRRLRAAQQRERTGWGWTGPVRWSRFIGGSGFRFWADIETLCHGDAVFRLEKRGMRSGGEVSAEFVDLGMMH